MNEGQPLHCPSSGEIPCSDLRPNRPIGTRGVVLTCRPPANGSPHRRGSAGWLGFNASLRPHAPRGCQRHRRRVRTPVKPCQRKMAALVSTLSDRLYLSISIVYVVLPLPLSLPPLSPSYLAATTPPLVLPSQADCHVFRFLAPLLHCGGGHFGRRLAFTQRPRDAPGRHLGGIQSEPV